MRSRILAGFQYWVIWSLGQRNKFISHPTTAIRQFTLGHKACPALPVSQCQPEGTVLSPALQRYFGIRLLANFLYGVRTCDVAMDEGSSQAMLVTAATGLSTRIEARYRLALHVDHLSPPVDPETTVRIVPDRIECRRVEWRFFDPIHGRIGPAPELRIATLVHVRVPLGHRFHQGRERHSLELMTAVDLRGQLRDRIGAEEEAIGRRCEWRIDVPFVTLDCSAVEDRPDRPGEEVWRPRTLVHRQRSVNAVGLGVGRLDICGA